MEALSADVLADILSRLPPLYLAVSRSVCKTWCAAVDDRGLLRAADLLPISMSGIFFVTSHDAELPIYFSRPPYELLSGASFDYLGYDCVWFLIDDYCNGLLLTADEVINPATRQCARLPHPARPPPPPGIGFCWCYQHDYLAFDPAATSPHYEVFRIYGIETRIRPREEVEWPPSPYALCVFSSRTREWEVKPFIREGDDDAGAIAARRSTQSWPCYTACWRGALYVQQHDILMRITLSNYKYRVTKLPKVAIPSETNAIRLSDYRIGKSKKGVYCALVIGRFRLLIWFLDEKSCGDMKWMLKKEVDLESLLANYPWKYGYGPWKQGRYKLSRREPTGEEFEWNSDDDSISGAQEIRNQDTPSQGVSLLGFHPNKEIVFLLRLDKDRVLAHHMNSSKIEDLGQISYMTCLDSSFPSTPCRMGEL